MKKNTIVRHCFSRKYISLCIFLLLGIIGEKAFAYSVWETYANETEGIYFSLQESIKITGVVKDNKGEPIIGANIVELNKKGNGTITDIDGKFTLSVSKNAEISISFIGFDEKKIKQLCSLFASCNRVYLYGIGSSGLVATEMQIRLMRLGLNVYSITDGHMMEMNSVIVDQECVVVGLSISGKT